MSKLIIGGREFSSRLFVGTGKFSSNDLMQQAILASESEMVTVAMKRVDMDAPQQTTFSPTYAKRAYNYCPTPLGYATPKRPYSPPNWRVKLSAPTLSNSKFTPTPSICSPTR